MKKLLKMTVEPHEDRQGIAWTFIDIYISTTRKIYRSVKNVQYTAAEAAEYD